MNNQVIKHLIVMNEFKCLIDYRGYGRGSSLNNLPHGRLALPQKHPKWHFGTGRFKWQLEDYIDRREDRPPFIEPTRPVNPELGKVVYVVKGSHPCKTEINNFNIHQMRLRKYYCEVKCGIEVLGRSRYYDVWNYGVKELKQKCKENGIKRYSKLKKVELVRALMKV